MNNQQTDLVILASKQPYIVFGVIFFLLEIYVIWLGALSAPIDITVLIGPITICLLLFVWLRTIKIQLSDNILTYKVLFWSKAVPVDQITSISIVKGLIKNVAFKNSNYISLVVFSKDGYLAINAAVLKPSDISCLVTKLTELNNQIELAESLSGYLKK